jgi:CHASE2 domain-containing sensor protein
VAHRHHGWGTYVMVAVVVCLVSTTVHVLWRPIWFHAFETAALDAFLSLRTSRPSTDITIVEIDDDDYARLFHESSPLDPAVITQLLDAIAASGPRVIGVDLDLSAARFAELPVTRWPNTVWAAAPILHGKLLAAAPPVGGARIPPLHSGIAAIPLDTDCRVRRFRRVFATPAGPRLAFSEAVVEAFRERGRYPRPEEDLDLNFFGDEYRFDHQTATNVLKASGLPAWRGALAGRIVLVGGTYGPACDRHYTPADTDYTPRPGVEIMAAAIESDLHHGGVTRANEFAMVFAEVLASLLIVFVNHHYLARREVGRALVASLLIAAVAAPAISLVTLESFAYWANFVPILIGVTIHQLYENAVHYRQLLQVREAQ